MKLRSALVYIITAAIAITAISCNGQTQPPPIQVTVVKTGEVLVAVTAIPAGVVTPGNQYPTNIMSTASYELINSGTTDRTVVVRFSFTMNGETVTKVDQPFTIPAAKVVEVNGSKYTVPSKVPVAAPGAGVSIPAQSSNQQATFSGSVSMVDEVLHQLLVQKYCENPVIYPTMPAQ